MLTSVKTSRRQGQSREGWSGGSPSAKRRADEQKSDKRPSSRVEWAPDHEDQQSALYGKSGGCVVIVHVLIRGELMRRWFVMSRARRSNASCDVSEVSSGHSSPATRKVGLTKDQRNRTRPCRLMLGTHVACAPQEVSIGA